MTGGEVKQEASMEAFIQLNMGLLVIKKELIALHLIPGKSAEE